MAGPDRDGGGRDAAVTAHLHEAERELRAFFELPGVGKAEVDPATLRFTRVNRRMCEIAGYEPDELLAMTVAELTHPDDRERDLALYRALQPGADDWSCEKRYVRKDGGVVWVSVTGTMVRGDDGTPLHSVATIQDVTARVTAQDALKASEERFRQLADSMPHLVWMARPDGTLEYFNRRWFDVTGLDEAESFAPGGWQAAVEPEDVPLAAERWAESVRTGQPFQVEVRYRSFTGERPRWQLVRALPGRDASGRVDRWYGTVTDVDERRRVEEALKTSEAAYRTLAENLPALVFRVFLQEGRRTVFFNDLLVTMTGYELEELAPGTVCAIDPLIVPEDRPTVIETVQEAARRGEPYEVEYRLRRKDGVVRHCRERGRTVLDATGRAETIDGVIFDVTGDKLAAEALRRARDEMEAQVTERTADLVHANRALRSEIAEREDAERRLRLHGERLRLLHETDRAVLAARSPVEIAGEVVRRVRAMAPCERAAVVLVDRETERGEILAVDTTGETRLPAGTSFRLGDTYLPRDAELHPFLVVEDLARVSPDSPVTHALVDEGVRGHLAVPLVTGGKLLGFLTLGSSHGQRFDEGTVELARQVADSLAVAIHSARLFEEVGRKRGELQTLLRRLVEVREDERRAVARELHDEAGQALTSLMLGLGSLERELAGSGVTSRRIAELKSGIDAVLEHLHELAVSLRPASLDRLGLAAAFRQDLEALGRTSGLEVKLTVVGLEEAPLAPVVEAALFHALREAVTNVARHAHATTVGVVLKRGEDEVLAIVEDDGKGFDLEAAGGGRLGLVGMREWVETVGGRLTVETAPGHGTTIYMEVPCGDTDTHRG